MISEDIINKYRICKSMKKTADELNVSFSVVRKTLITAGIHTSPLIEQIKSYSDVGASDADIAKALNVSLQTVNANKPYIRGTYLDKNKSANAVRIKRHRKKKENT